MCRGRGRCGYALACLPTNIASLFGVHAVGACCKLQALTKAELIPHKCLDIIVAKHLVKELCLFGVGGVFA